MKQLIASSPIAIHVCAVCDRHIRSAERMCPFCPSHSPVPRVMGVACVALALVGCRHDASKSNSSPLR